MFASLLTPPHHVNITQRIWAHQTLQGKNAYQSKLLAHAAENKIRKLIFLKLLPSAKFSMTNDSTDIELLSEYIMTLINPFRHTLAAKAEQF